MKMKTDGGRRCRRSRLGGLLLLVALGALVLAGCGGSSSSSESSSSESSSTTASAGTTNAEGEAGGGPGGRGGFEISEEARACLKEKGVELPEFKGGQGGPPEGGELPEGGAPPNGERPEGGAGGFGGEQNEETKEAFEACGVETPEGGAGGAPNTNSAAFRKQIKKYVACVRENGYELPEPNLSGEGAVFDESEVNQEDPEFKKASAKCQSLLGGARGNGGSEEAG